VEPRIQYAQTKDGVSIAFWTLGEGTPVVSIPWFPSHAQLRWKVPEMRRLNERMAQGRRLISYDSRGTGLSDRDVTDFSLDAFMLDLDAVVGHLELERFALMGTLHTGMAAIVYAARHPERVTRLLLWGSFARMPDVLGTPALQAARTLRDSDWKLFTETLGHYGFGLAEGEQAQRYAAYFRESVTQQVWRAFESQWEDLDVSDVLPQVRSPTLVLHARGSLIPVDAARHLASRIPNARLALVEARTLGFTMENFEAVVAAAHEFLSEGDEAAPTTPLAKEDVHTILFTDMEGSTTLTERLGDAKAQELRRTHDSIVRDALKAQGGSETKHTGDGIMASFPSASRAIECAVAVQRAIAEHGETPLRVRIGLNAGEPVAEEADLFGTAVNLAKRICDQAEPGQILVSDVVQQLAAGKGFTFADKGEATLKGFEKPVRLHEVRWQD
jgi:class 3 adenylate cyclase